MKKAILTLLKAPKAMQKTAIFFSSKNRAAAQGRGRGGGQEPFGTFYQNSSVLVLPGFPHPLCIGVIVIGGESVTV